MQEKEFTYSFMTEKINEIASDPARFPPLFPDFPDGATDDCAEIADAKLEELERQLGDDSCKYDTKTFQYVKGLKWEPVAVYLTTCSFLGFTCFSPPKASDVTILGTKTIPPPEANKRPCPVDTSLLDDVEKVRSIINK